MSNLEESYKDMVVGNETKGLKEGEEDSYLRTKVEQINKLCKDHGFDLYMEFSDEELPNTFDELTTMLDENNLFDEYIMYYTTAMDYLRDNDPSLRFSLELASRMGYEMENINSEILASILKADNNKDTWNDLEGEIQEILDGEIEENEED